MTQSFLARRFVSAALLGASLIPFASNALAQEPSVTIPVAAKSSPIVQELKRLGETGSMLYVAAHPDDENTQLITYLARGRNLRTAYLSLTRGDGGQNVIGAEFGASLGLIRTQELLAARKLDGARQFFTRALDFGYSKSAAETLAIWDQPQVLSDVVRVIRTFRPDVIVTRFSPDTGGTHGHHTASAILAREAFKLAGDATAFPEQLHDLKPWQPKRILQNGRGEGGLTLDISGNDAVTGESFAAIAGRSRAMHISQGFAGYTGNAQSRPETFQLSGGETATKDLLEGVDTTWNRFPGGAEIARLIGEVSAEFDAQNPAASVPVLLQLRTRMATLPADSVVEEKRRDLDRIIRDCIGLSVKTTVSQTEVVSGETIKLRHTAKVESDIPVRWVTAGVIRPAPILRRGQEATHEFSLVLPSTIRTSQPYWLRQEPTAGMARVEDSRLIGQPENPPDVFFGMVQHRFEISGQMFSIPIDPVQAADATQSERRVEIIPPVSLRLSSDVRLFSPGATKPVEVEVTAARAATNGSLQLDVPAGWKVTPATQSFRLATVGQRAKFSFSVTAPAQNAVADISARAMVNGAQISTGRVEINYPHIPRLLLQPPARLKAVALDLVIRGREVAYLPGAGDNVAQALEEMGYIVTPISGADLVAEKLRRFDAVVIGVRAFNVRTDLVEGLPALFAYVEGGGNVIAQYNRPNDLKTTKLAPFDLNLSGLRVTDERAPVTFLAPDHPALNSPNKITAADFEGWVQERGIYFPDKWDERFTPILSMGDAGEEPLKGGLLVAKYGRGNFVYSSLVWFRQLPAGVPGAYRLMANLVSLGK